MADSESMLANMSQLTEDFWIDLSVKVLKNPSPIEFLRESYSSYTPSILTDMMSDWAAYEKWDMSYLLEKLGDKEVKVNFTPDGRADFVIDHSNSNTVTSNNNYDVADGKVFVYPLQAAIPFSVLHKMLTDPLATDAIPYLSEQNDNFRQEFSELSTDIPHHFDLAEACFGNTKNPQLSLPEAVNLWIGDERSVSSLHKDHFENFYAVLHGTKTFTLFPPTDTAFLPESCCKTAIYKQKTPYIREAKTSSSCISPTFIIKKDRIQKTDLYLSSDVSGHNSTNTTTNDLPSELSWIPIDPDPDLLTTNSTHTSMPSTVYATTNNLDGNIEYLSKTHEQRILAEFPQYKYAHPIRCQVHAGEILYIPAMWYHRVSQSCLTIAVNYWYDQRFDFRYVFYQTVRKICENVKNTSTAETILDSTTVAANDVDDDN